MWHIIVIWNANHKNNKHYEKSLNSDGHQFHLNQLNEQSPFVSPEHKKITAYDVGNPGPGSDMHKNVAGLTG